MRCWRGERLAEVEFWTAYIVALRKDTMESAVKVWDCLPNYWCIADVVAENESKEVAKEVDGKEAGGIVETALLLVVGSDEEWGSEGGAGVSFGATCKEEGIISTAIYLMI